MRKQISTTNTSVKSDPTRNAPVYDKVHQNKLTVELNSIHDSITNVIVRLSNLYDR